MLYYGLNGDLKFKNKELESALENYKKAAEINENIENAFLSERIYTRLAAGYLALDSLAPIKTNRKIKLQHPHMVVLHVSLLLPAILPRPKSLVPLTLMVQGRAQ